PMDHLRSAFSRMLQVRKQRYSRFTLQPTEDGERHVEIKLCEDSAEADRQPGGSPCFRPASLQHMCFCGLAFLLTICLGCLIGVICSRKLQVALPSCESPSGMTTVSQPKMSPAADIPAEETELTWKDISQLLKHKLTSASFTKALSEFDSSGGAAGSEEDERLGDLIFNQFKEQSMEPWTDQHYVQLQTPDSQRPNRVRFGSAVFYPEGYLAYSAPGSVEGKLVYGNYGRQEDLQVLHTHNVGLEGSVLLLRAGNISFAEQVANAAANGAAAVLIYPDPEQHTYRQNTPLYGHVHLGSGDPYTPGFPSFNHTQFPPTQSSGLPKIPAQTLTARDAIVLLQNISGPEAAADSGFKGGLSSLVYRLGGEENITVEVNNVLVNRKIHNVFGVIKGFIDPDRYVVLGAQRDAWGKGYTRATVGTSVLVELAKAVRQMVERDGFQPRRSIIFASWSAGEYGSVGATEWLEGYMSSIGQKVVTYISLDGVVMGSGSFVASASPLLYSLLESTMKEVQEPAGSGTLYSRIGPGTWEASVMRPMKMDDPAYPFLAFAGIPSISFHFISKNTDSYMYYGTDLDNKDHLNYQTGHKTGEVAAAAAQVAGQMALRLAHDHLLKLDTRGYSSLLQNAVSRVYKRILQLSQSGQLKEVNPKWVVRARGSFNRAANSIKLAMDNTDLTDQEACRILNDRLMRVESTLLSPYESPVETPFRHLLLGRGPHTLASIAECTDMESLRVQLALATWNLQGCANAMMGNIWDINDKY
uniref:Transferrin receptor 1b n=1 Tax=Tetraodon nigroviridis TaxID=99883 RepID=H3D7Z0_TETNG